MSFELTAWALRVERPESLSGDWTTAKLVLATMATFADAQAAEPACFASVATIADRVGTSPATVKRAITALRAAALIEPLDAQPGKPVSYRFLQEPAADTPEIETDLDETADLPRTRVTDDLGHRRPRSRVIQGVGHRRSRGWVTGDPQTELLSRDLTNRGSAALRVVVNDCAPPEEVKPPASPDRRAAILAAFHSGRSERGA